MRYSQLMSKLQTHADGVSLDVPDGWMQGRSMFGGLQAAVLVAAMRRIIPAVPLRTLQVTFIAPVPQGTVSAQATLLRSGKNASHVEARLLVDGKPACIAIGVFGVARESAVKLLPVQQPVRDAKMQAFPYVEGISPVFLQHFAATVQQGEIPYAGKPVTELVVDLAMRDEPGVMTTESHALAIADFVWPVALGWLKSLSNGSSLTWMLEFFTSDFQALALGGWRVDAKLVAGVDGYTSQSVMLWGPGGVPVAISRQSMVVFG